MLPFEKSFASHEKAKFWSSYNEKGPEYYALNSHTKCWFDCDKCNHKFEKMLKYINLIDGWCPYCVNKKICLDEDCVVCYEKSFASHEKATLWSVKNVLTPRQVFKNSHKKYLFNCDKCNHLFDMPLSSVSSKNAWCNYCANRKMCYEQNCVICFNKSFASHEKSNFWSDKNVIESRKVFKKSAVKYWFKCNKCSNDFESKVCHVSDGSWCPKCRYKTEDKLHKILLELYPTIKDQYKADWCKNIKHLPFDFVLEEYKIIIELDGESHFKQVAKWKTFEHNRARDLYKMKCAQENGFSMIRILQEDVYYNKYNWLQELKDNINKIIDDNRVQNIYMCKNNEYKDFDI